MKYLLFLFIVITAFFLSCNNSYTMPGRIMIISQKDSFHTDQVKIMAIVDDMDHDSIKSEMIYKFADFDSVSIRELKLFYTQGIFDNEYVNIIAFPIEFKRSQTSDAYKIVEYYKGLINSELQKNGFSPATNKKFKMFDHPNKRNMER